MDAAVAALIGAGVGAVVPAVVSSWSAWLQNERAKDAHQDAREARLFEHRRDAYVTFISVANGLASRYNRHYMDGEPLEMDDADPLRAVINQASLVQLYGSPDCGALAQDAWVAVAKYVHHGRENSGLVFDFQVALERFIEHARTDLGVPELTLLETPGA